jgi:hypothetical protein
VPPLSDDAFRVVLRRIEDHILGETGNRFERLVVLDAAARPLLVKDGSGGDVYLAEDEAARLVGRADFITHNHPRGTTLTDGDVLAAIGLGIREFNAFGPHVRYRLLRRADGGGWPSQMVAAAAVREIDLEIRDRLRLRVASGAPTRLEAEALHRRLRWVRFAERFGVDVDYREERR